jgi:hypothetical protein
MEEPPGGHAAAGQDRVSRFTAKTVASSPGPASTATLSATTMRSPAFWYKRIQKASECGATGLAWGVAA